MTAIALPWPEIHFADDRDFDCAKTLADGLIGIVRIARALASTGRTIDLTGLDTLTGLLCARAMSLPAEQGRTLIPLMTLANEEVQRLTTVLHASPTAWVVASSTGNQLPS